MDQGEFNKLMERAKKVRPAAAAAPAMVEGQAPAPVAAADPAPVASDPAAPNADFKPMYDLPAGQQYPTEPGLGDPSSPVESFVGGGLKSIFETKDFLFGDTKPAERSPLRLGVEETVKQNSEASIVDGLAAGIGQFTGAMIGLGKFLKAGQLAGEAIGVGSKAASAVMATKKARTVAESVKAATAGAVAFDPHEERLSNLIQNTPLANPINAWLAADPTDSAAEGRFKAALESIGLDAAIIGTFTAGVKIWKAVKTGDKAGAAKAISQLEAAKAANEAEVSGNVRSAEELGAGGPAPLGTPEAPPAGGPEALGGERAGGEGPLGGAAGVAGEVPNADITQTPAVRPSEGAQGTGGAPQADAVIAADDGLAGSRSVQGTPETPQLVANASDAAAAAGERLGTTARPTIRMVDEDSEALIKAMRDDADAFDKYGGFKQAVGAGHSFGKGEGIPWARFDNPSELDHFMARLIDSHEEALDKMKGGKSLPDAKLEKITDGIVKVFNVDPGAVLTSLKQAGEQAAKMPAMVEAGMLVTRKMFQDLHALALRIDFGDFSEFGSREAALAEMTKRAQIASSTYGSVRSMIASGGRTTRRGAFAIDPKALSAVDGGMSADQMIQMLKDTNGNPRAIARVVTNRAKAMDAFQFLLVNNLVSGPATQAINIITSSAMLGIRPLERIIGGTFYGDGLAVKAALKQYAYMGTSFTEGFRYAVKTFMQNDSVLAPHKTEFFNAPSAKAVGDLLPTLKPWTSITNILGNALTVGAKGIGLPTRLLGFVDEAIKQTSYRSKVMADAHITGAQKGLEAGLTGADLADFVTSYVRDAVDNSIDDLGRATNYKALQEAQIVTFQQDLKEGTMGKGVSVFANNHPIVKLVLPFIKTPTNVMRYGWKMTPGLNLLQTEYREMLTGAYGAEAKAQAIGQMSLGILALGTTAYGVSQGNVVGGFPKDPKLRAALVAAGAKEYSFVVENADGSKTYIPYNRFDPVAIPIGITADIMTAIGVLGEEDGGVEEAIGALRYALSRQLTNKTYLQGLSQAMDAINDPNGQVASNWIGSQVSNLVPFSAAMRQLDTDPYLREARTITDRLMDTIPGMGLGLPPKYDTWGDPIGPSGRFYSSTLGDIVDDEIIRLGLESGSTQVGANPVNNGVDLREITLANGKNAFAEYQRLSGHLPGVMPLKERVAKLIQSPTYKRAPDGDVGTKGTKLWLMHAPVERYRRAAMKILKRDPAVRDAFGEREKKVRDHYSELRGEPQRYPEAHSQINKVGTAFGVDLSPK